jgi:eukaryotic-like serine/threonine-protein kinase
MGVTVGSRLAQYELTALVGAGGMGRVFQARDTRLGRSAPQGLPDAFAPDTDRIARFGHGTASAF